MFWDVELRAEIEQGALADLGALALQLDEAEGGIVLAVARPGAADEPSPFGCKEFVVLPIGVQRA